MYRGKWTLLRWCMNSFRYVPCAKEYEKSPVSLPRRIPSIDKLSQSTADPRPLQFLQLLKHSPYQAADKLGEWCDNLSVDTLEDFTRVLLSSVDYKQLPNNVSAKLDMYGLSDWLTMTEEAGVDDYYVSKMQNVLQPLDLLKEVPHLDSQILQKLLDRTPNRLDPVVGQLEREWASQLMASDKFTISDGKELGLMNQNLDWKTQCQLVAQFLAEFTAQNVHSPFPLSLAGTCLKLGLQMTDEMLNVVADSHKIPRLNRYSPFLWGLIGEDPWGPKKHIILGAAWLYKVTRICKFHFEKFGKHSIRPAFWKTWFINKTHRRGVIVANNDLLIQLKKSSPNLSDTQAFITSRNLPMLIKPRPWTSNATNNPVTPRKGMKLIASPSNEGDNAVKYSLESGAALTQIRGLNHLQNQGWRVNLSVLNFIKSTIKPGEKLQPAVAIADALAKRPFYLPMYMDFRGRCYPSAKIYLNFMTDDATRALFMFEKSQTLGSSGLKWLSIHLANMSEQCKSHTYASRLDWVNQHRQDIIKSADNPHLYQWWRQITTKPFQLLAACLELRNAWSLADPSLYQSNLPVQLDGTSNGLQHLVALARDEDVAPLVNLAPSNNKCGDVYTTVADDIKSGCEDADMDYEISRKDIKSAVMTYFYGASERTIKNFLGVKKNSGEFDSQSKSKVSIKENAPDNNESDSPAHFPSPDLADFFNLCINNKFHREREVQLWLTDCARRIVSSRSPVFPFPGDSLKWTSPLGLPIVQPYVEEPQNYAIRTSLQSFWLTSPYHLQASEPLKQAKSVNANYIHSLDAAHMLLTSLKMPSGLSFAAIHDSFWTHASSVDIMNITLREAFIEIHERDLLDELKDEWQTRYDGHMSLANVYADSHLYDRIVWDRSGVSGGEEQKKMLDKELIAHHHLDSRLDYQRKYWNKVVWKNSKPFLGTPGNHFVKMWVPLQLPLLPQKGKLNLDEIRNSEYFFN